MKNKELCVFKRYEKKYIMSKEQCEKLTAIIKLYAKKDEYGLYPISNIYYDTDDYQLIRHSLAKPDYKEKFRVRSYGAAAPEDKVFMELKKKVCGIVYKRRIGLCKQEAEGYLESGCLSVHSQVIDEVDWFLSKNPISAKAFIGYDRVAFIGNEDKELRITFDYNICFRNYDLDLSCGKYGVPILDNGQVLMEIKISGSMPVWLSRALSQLEIFPTSFSKYGTAYTKYIGAGICADKKLKGVVNCA